MTLDDFLDFLAENGISFKTTYNSIVLNDCPHCNAVAEKVWLYKDRRNESGPFFGKCMKCDEKMNSRSYLIALGYPRTMVDNLHGAFTEGFKLDARTAIDDLTAIPELQIAEQPVEDLDISMFLPLPEVSTSEAALYAIKRGWTDKQKDDILIDYYGNAVVFIVRYEGKVVGYQRRLVHPFDPKLKTLSSQNFQKRRFVLEFPNDGDICVVEGPFTALSAWHYGYYAICTFGSNVGEQQIDTIANLAQTKKKDVAIGFDLDSAGKKGYCRIRAAMTFRKLGSYRVRPEYGNDLNDSWMAGKSVLSIMTMDVDQSIPELDLPFASFI